MVPRAAVLRSVASAAVSGEQLAEHLERYLGPIAGTWSRDPLGEELPFEIAHYVSTKKGGSKAPAGTEIYSTFGLSDYELGRNRLRIEMLMIVPARTTAGAIPPILLHAGSMPVEANAVPEYGDTFTDVAALREISPMDTLYVGRPLYQPPEFQRLTTRHRRVYFQWLIPIYDVEAEFIDKRGWPAFEQLMWDLDVDPTDTTRQPWLE